MRFILLVAVLLSTQQQTTAIPYAITQGNVSVQTDIQALRNGFQVEITQHGDGQAGRGGYVLHDPQNALGEWVLSGQARVFFEQGSLPHF